MTNTYYDILEMYSLKYIIADDEHKIHNDDDEHKIHYS